MVAEQSQHPQKYVAEYDRFLYLIDGRAEQEVEQYIKESHEFEELSEKVRFFDDLGNTLTTSLPKEVNLGMFELHCEDLIMVKRSKVIWNIFVFHTLFSRICIAKRYHSESRC